MVGASTRSHRASATRPALGVTGLSNFTKLSDSARRNPLHHKNVAFMVEASAVGTNKPPGHKRPRRLSSGCPPIRLRIFAFAQGCHNFILPIENDHLTQQVCDHNVPVALVQETRHLRCALDGIDALPFQRKALQAAIAAVGHDQHWRLCARVHPKAVRTIYLVVPLAESGEGANEFSLLVVLIDKTRTVAIANVDVAVGSDGHVRRPVDNSGAVAFLLVGRGFRRVSQREYFFALQSPLGYDAVLEIAEVEKLLIPFFTERQPVRSAFELSSPGTDELTFLIEDHHRVQTLAGCVDRVMDIDVAL